MVACSCWTVFVRLEDDLAEMAASRLEPEGLRDRSERKGAVDHRVAMDGIDAADQSI